MLLRIETRVKRQHPRVIPEQKQPETHDDEQERFFQPWRCGTIKGTVPDKRDHRSERDNNNPKEPGIFRRIECIFTAGNRITGPRLFHCRGQCRRAA